MNTFDLPAADPTAVRIREAASRGTLSHALLFTGSGDRLAAARYAAAALECTADGVRPCGVCEGCRKVRSGIAEPSSNVFLLYSVSVEIRSTSCVS